MVNLELSNSVGSKVALLLVDMETVSGVWNCLEGICSLKGTGNLHLHGSPFQLLFERIVRVCHS